MRNPVKALPFTILVGTALCVLALIVAIGGMALAVSSARSEDAKPSEVTAPAPAAPTQPPQKFYLEVDASDLQAISQALNELPKRVADPLILKLNAQLQAAAQVQIKDGKASASTEKNGDEKAKKGDREKRKN